MIILNDMKMLWKKLNKCFDYHDEEETDRKRDRFRYLLLFAEVIRILYHVYLFQINTKEHISKISF